MTSNSTGNDHHVGVLAMEVYFPSTYVSQEDLEIQNNCRGKYRLGLGQEAMSFVGDLEDINSISLTVVNNLLIKYSIPHDKIGRLEIGTETLLDKSKSTKTILMELFTKSGNTDIEGVTVINACYGGTAALLNALLWCDSSAWDGRYAIVVAADIAVYADGPARPTGGCGAVAMLIGRNAPLPINLHTRVCHSAPTWDFFKPRLDSDYPEVNGALSQTCYLKALDDCYLRFLDKQQQKVVQQQSTSSNTAAENGTSNNSNKNSNRINGLNDVDEFLFHSPYNKLVQKSFNRLVYLDVLQKKSLPQNSTYEKSLEKWLHIPIESTYDDKNLEIKLKEMLTEATLTSKLEENKLYESKVATGCVLSQNIGNTYTASLYMNLAQLIATKGENGLLNKKVVLFSYGSGAMASLFEIQPRIPTTTTTNCINGSINGNNSVPTTTNITAAEGIFSIERMQTVLNITQRLASRQKHTPTILTQVLNICEKSHDHAPPYTPLCNLDSLFPGTFYLREIKANYERVYEMKSLDSERVTDCPMFIGNKSDNNTSNSTLAVAAGDNKVTGTVSVTSNIDSTTSPTATASNNNTTELTSVTQQQSQPQTAKQRSMSSISGDNNDDDYNTAGLNIDSDRLSFDDTATPTNLMSSMNINNNNSGSNNNSNINSGNGIAAANSVIKASTSANNILFPSPTLRVSISNNSIVTSGNRVARNFGIVNGVNVGVGGVLNSTSNNNIASSMGSGTSNNSGGVINEGFTLGLKRNETVVWASGKLMVKVVVTGVAAVLPGRNKQAIIKPSSNNRISNNNSADTTVYPISNIHRIINGECFVSEIPDAVKDAMLEKNVMETVKNKITGVLEKRRISSYAENINLCAAMGTYNLADYGVSESIASTMDVAVQVAIIAGLEALKHSGIVSGVGVNGWVLPEHFQDTTGVVFATSFPALDTAIAEVSKFYECKAHFNSVKVKQIVKLLKEKFRIRYGTSIGNADNSTCTTSISNGTEKDNSNSSNGSGDSEIEAAIESLVLAAQELATATKLHVSTSPTTTATTGMTAGTGVSGSSEEAEDEVHPYEFDRKFLFRVLVLGNAQLAQIIKARGPNMQTNAACAGATQAIALAYDMIQVGRAERVIVIAGDNASSDTLMPWLGNGFRALGAATIQSDPKKACMPFNAERSGMILGSGGIGIMLESEDGARRRYQLQIAQQYSSSQNSNNVSAVATVPTAVLRKSPFCCRLLGTLISNSAYHGASMDKAHIASEMERFISGIEKEHGISRKEIAMHGVYFSHETSTHASATSSCAYNELFGLRKVFGEHFKHLLILNTKGFTGHPMGVSFEDVVAAEVLMTGRVPPIANLTTADPVLGDDLKLRSGRVGSGSGGSGEYPCKYALRFAAGFGSQVALALYGSADTS